MAPRNGNGPRIEREPFLETRSDEGHRGNPAPYFTPITPDFKFLALSATHRSGGCSESDDSAGLSSATQRGLASFPPGLVDAPDLMLLSKRRDVVLFPKCFFLEHQGKNKSRPMERN